MAATAATVATAAIAAYASPRAVWSSPALCCREWTIQLTHVPIFITSRVERGHKKTLYRKVTVSVHCAYSYILIYLSESTLGDIKCISKKFSRFLHHPLNTTRILHAHLGYARYSTFDQLTGHNQIALKKILESDEDSNVSAVVKVKDLYRSCVNTAAINAQGATPLLEVINSTGEEEEGINVGV